MAKNNRVLGFIRNIFKRDNMGSEDGPRIRRSKYSAFYNQGNAYSNIMVQGTNQYGDQGGSMQEDLLSRYADYEDMDDVAELNTSLDIVSDDSTQTDQLNGNIVHVDAEDDRVNEILETAFHKNIMINDRIWEMCRTVCKYGNGFYEHVLTENDGIVDLTYYAPPQMRRVDDEDGSLLGFIYDKSGTFNITDEEFEQRIRDRSMNEKMYYEGNRMTNVFEDWEMTHFRNRSKHPGSQYGWSFLEGARWTVKRLNMLEDAALLYKLSRAQQRFIFNVDVGDLPPNEAVKHLNKVKQSIKKHRIVDPNTGKLDLGPNLWSNQEDFFVAKRKGEESMSVDTVGGFDSQFYMDDLEYFKDKLYSAIKIPKDYLNFSEDSVSKANLCLVPETMIPLMDGRNVSMKQLIDEYNDGKINYVYSIDKDNFVKAGKITNALWTRKNADLVRVHLDNGEYIDCTPDHPFMLRNGEFKQAQDLKENESLMPYYERVSEGKMKGYYEVYNPNKDEYEFVHRIVFDQFYGERNGRIIHHVNFNKCDNHPDNLFGCSDHEEHLNIHRKHYSKTLGTKEAYENNQKALNVWRNSDECKAVLRENLKNNREKLTNGWCKSDRHRQLKSEQMKKQWEEGQFNHQKDLSWKQKFSKTCKELYRMGKKKPLKGKDNPSYRDVSVKEIGVVALKHGLKSKRELFNFGYSQSLIDRVLKEAGVSFKEFSNKYLGGYKLCRKDSPYNHKVVSVEVLSEKRDTCDITVENFHNFATCAGVFVHNSQEDIRWARTVMRVQRTLRTGLVNMGRVQLASRGIDPDHAEFDIYLTPPSSIFEMAMNEVRQSQLEIAESYREWVDDYWIFTNILKFTDDEYTEIKERLKKQKESEDPFSENRFPTLENKFNRPMKKEVEKILEDLDVSAVEGFLKDPKVGKRLRELKGLGEELKHVLKRKK